MTAPVYGARLSACDIYRYSLFRDGLLPDTTTRGLLPDTTTRVVFIMLNPSTADHRKDDPTIRRCMGFARSWGMSRLDVVNLFAFRATDTADLANARVVGHDIVGPDNDYEIALACYGRPVVVAAWGLPKWGWVAERAETVRRTLLRRGAPLSYLALTKKRGEQPRHPRHPLYLKADLRPQAWEEAPPPPLPWEVSA